MAILIFEGENGIAGILTYKCFECGEAVVADTSHKSHGDLRAVPFSLEMGKNPTYASL